MDTVVHEKVITHVFADDSVGCSSVSMRVHVCVSVCACLSHTDFLTYDIHSVCIA